MAALNQDAVVNQVCDLFEEVTDHKITASSENLRATDLLLDERMDSLDLINLLFRLEETYGIKVPESDIDDQNLTVVGNLAEYIANKCSGDA